jgi:hypothetical protein
VRSITPWYHVPILCVTAPVTYRAWTLISSAAAATATAAVAFTSTAHCNKFTEGVKKARKRQFFKYEKRLRLKSTHEKMFEYFSSRVKDGKQCMTAQDILRALISVYPPEDATWTRSGSLDGERAPMLSSVRLSRFLHLFPGLPCIRVTSH